MEQSVFVEDYPQVVEDAAGDEELGLMFLPGLVQAMQQYEQRCVTAGDVLRVVVHSDGSGHLETGEGGDFLHFGDLFQARRWMDEAARNTTRS